jgi:hypothetical protein
VDLCVAVELRRETELGASTTVRVNRHGALVRSPRMLAVGDELEVRNLLSGEAGRFRVAWAGPTVDNARLFDLGLELLDERPGFWGARYEHLSRWAQDH